MSLPSPGCRMLSLCLGIPGVPEFLTSRTLEGAWPLTQSTFIPLQSSVLTTLKMQAVWFPAKSVGSISEKNTHLPQLPYMRSSCLWRGENSISEIPSARSDLVKGRWPFPLAHLWIFQLFSPYLTPIHTYTRTPLAPSVWHFSGRSPGWGMPSSQ